MIEDSIRYSLLLDKYRELLAHRQVEVCELYFDENLSLYEIAEEFSISKQAVHDALKKAEAALDEYETKLGLVERDEKNNKVIEDLRELIGNGDAKAALKKLEEFEK